MGTPFPWPPMVAIAIGLVANAYALSSLFPYVGYMVQHLGVTDDKDKAGFYAGYLSSAFMVGRFGSSYFWGRFGDRYGRLPVIYIGLCSIAILLIAFGLSPTFGWALACRFLLGTMNGLLGVFRTVISEVCGREHEMVGMSFITGCWSIGLVLGPGLGGLLAEPANHYPGMFSESGLFGRFPYLLPNIFGAGVAVMGLPLVYFFLEETLDTHKCGDRRGFKLLQASEAALHSPGAAVGTGRGIKTIDLDDGYDIKPAKENRARSHSASSGGGGRVGEGGRATTGCPGKRGCEAVGNSGCNGSSAQARAEEQLPLAGRPLTSYSGGGDLDEKELLSMVHDGARGSARSGGGGIRQEENLEAGGRKSREGGKRSDNTFLREFLLPFKLLGEKRVRTILFVYVLFSVLDFGFHEAYPLWTISSVGSGGLDWTTHDVGQALSACGGSILIFQLFIYPRIVKRVAARKLQRWACCVAIPVLLSYPFLARLHDSETALLVASLVLLVLTSMATTTVVVNFFLAINNAVDPSQLSTVNGLSVMVGSLAKAAGPTAASTTFAWSIQHRHRFPFDQHLVFCLLALGMVFVAVMSWDIDISPVEQKPKGTAAAVPVVMAEEAPKKTEESV